MTKKSSSVTIRDVAREAGVSVATVSRYINHNAPISAEVAERLDRVMTDLQFVPHAAARQLASKKASVVGLLLTNMHNIFFGSLLDGIESAVREKEYNLIVATHQSNSTDIDERLPIGPHNVDGMLVFADCLNDAQLCQLVKKKFPIVLIHRTPPPSLPIPYVTVENKAATRMLIDHLIEVHGRRRIVFLRGPEKQEDSYWRELGYRSSLEAHQIAIDPQLILCGDFEREIAYRAIKDFVASPHPDFDAVFSGDDEAAFGVITALEETGYHVPNQVSVVGFDDQKLSAFLNPSLTTVRAPTEEVGRVAVECMFAILQGARVNPSTLLPTEIVYRHSCGCVV